MVEAANSFIIIQSQNLSPQPGLWYTGGCVFCREFYTTAKQIIVVPIHLTTRFRQQRSLAPQILLHGAHDILYLGVWDFSFCFPILCGYLL